MTLLLILIFIAVLVFAAPRLPSLAKERPMALVTGPKDFNYKEMLGRIRILQKEGFRKMRFFEYAELGHTLPNATQFAEALHWVDAFYQSDQNQRESKAKFEFDTYMKVRSNSTPTNSNDHDVLVKIIQDHPWTESAKQAMNLLLNK